MTNEITTPIFNKVLFTPFYNPNVGQDRPITYIDNENDIIKPKNKEGCEYVGDKIVSPYFDTDYKISFETPENDIKKIEEEKRNECLTIINKCFDKYDVSINESDKKCRLIEQRGKKAYKISQRYYVKGVVMKNSNILKLLNINGITDNNKPFDLEVYNDTRILLLPYTHKPAKPDDKSKTILKPIKKEDEDFNVFNYCATYIKETDIDLDYLFEDDLKILKPKKKTEVINVATKEDNFINDEDVAIVDKSYLENKLKIIIDKLNTKRSDDYDSWTKLVWCLINICKKEGITRSKCYKLIHQFSKKSKNYEEDNVDDFADKNFDNIKSNCLSWNYLYNICLKEDDFEYYENINCKTYFTAKKDFEETHSKILYPPMIVNYNRDGEYNTFNIKSCKETYIHLDCKKSVLKKGEKIWETVKFIDEWLKDSKIRRYDKIVFKPPPLIAKSFEFNTWIDFKIAKETLIKTERDYFKEYCTYLNNLVGEEKIANYILARYAYRIQNPAIRTGVCLILCGNEGDGKNKLLEPIYKIMDKYTTMLDTAKKLYDTHSMFEKEQLFILINEAGGTANFDNSEILKTRITESELSINPKGITAYKIDNMCDYDMTTNNFNVVKLSDDSHRRFLQVETTSYYRGNTVFFQDYHNNIVQNPIALRQIYEGLINYDVKKIIPSGNFQDVNDKPSTNIEKEVKQQNRDKIIWFLEDYTRQFYEEDPKTVKNDDLFISWKFWCDKSNVKIEYNKIQFGIKLSQVMKKQLNTKGVICIIKDTSNSKTTLYFENLKKYFCVLNGCNFITDKEEIIIE